jgi:hypothetical protein
MPLMYMKFKNGLINNNAMDKEFVTYEQSLALKELGFNEECFGYYVITTLLITTDNVYDSKEIPVIKAPLKQQVFDFFREKYNLEGIVQRWDDCLWYKFGIYNLYKDCKLMISAKLSFNTPEEAENACIDKLISICKQQDK